MMMLENIGKNSNNSKFKLKPIFLYCRLFPFFFYGNVAASLMNMVAITINR